MSVSTHAVEFEFTAIFRTRNSIDTATRRKAATSTDVRTGDRSLVVRASQHGSRDVKPRDHIMWVRSKMLCCCPRKGRKIMGSGWPEDGLRMVSGSGYGGCFFSHERWKVCLKESCVHFVLASAVFFLITCMLLSCTLRLPQGLHSNRQAWLSGPYRRVARWAKRGSSPTL